MPGITILASKVQRKNDHSVVTGKLLVNCDFQLYKLWEVIKILIFF